MTTAREERTNGFDRLSRVYRSLEWLAFGRDLERARFQHLDRLRDCNDILILGEGDGRCLARLVQIAPHARVHCVDVSGGMIARARRRLAENPATSRALARVRFEQADARGVTFRDEAYDAVLTFFFLDCFRPPDVEALVARIQRALRPAAPWLYADFEWPRTRWARRRARLWLRLLYAFFRWQTNIDASDLPASEAIIAHAGWREVATADFRGGFIRSVVFERA